MEITTPHGAGDKVRCENSEKVIESALVRPIDTEKLEVVRNEFVKQHGTACLVELAAVIGAIDHLNKFSQATGRPAMPKIVIQIVRFVFGIIRFLYELVFGK